MSNVTKNLVVDYYFGLSEPENTQQIEKTIKEEQEYSRFYISLERTVGSLSMLAEEKCPDCVVDGLFKRISEKTRSQINLESLLKNEVEYKKRRNFALLTRFSRVAAIIAIVIGVGATYMPAAKHMRLVSLRNLCQNNLSNIGVAMANYAGDNAGMLPSVGVAAGSPWWKVGSQKETDHSNTRNQWLLVRNGYCDVNDFICPARPVISDGRLKMTDFCSYQKDFPSKDFVNYSFRLANGTPAKIIHIKAQPVAADSNPLFEEMSMDKYTFFKTFKLNDQLRNAKSINHYGSGQNVLFADNSIGFHKDRMQNDDDIYTIHGTESYNGTESPIDSKDVFLAP